jgi:hypothetical protein
VQNVQDLHVRTEPVHENQVHRTRSRVLLTFSTAERIRQSRAFLFGTNVKF